MPSVTSLTLGDLESPLLRDKLTAMGQQFIAEAGHPVPFNAGYFFEQWRTLIQLGVGEFFVIRDEDSLLGVPIAALGALFSKDMFSGVLCGAEIFWFVAPEARNSGKLGIQLFNAFESRCGRLGVKIRVMAHLEGLRGEALTRLYHRRGYEKSEQTFRKVV